jgi:lipid II:glycine glycyltransferase (peptidoglycan interpeptide bridge formation enzyme)
LILLHNDQVAIDAYSGSSEKALLLRANDFMIFSVVNFCLDEGIGKFDFGSDLPQQESLINYKTKWLGQRKRITSSTWGNVKDFDYNWKIYEISRPILSRLPLLPYQLISRFLIR